MEEVKSIVQAEHLLMSVMDLGENMLKSGGEILRVENTISRICKTYGCKRVDVFIITSFISVTIQTDDNRIITQNRRIYSYANNLRKLEELNSLSRYICANQPSLNEMNSMMSEVVENDFDSKWVRCVGGVIAALAFTPFFGGTILDSVAAGMIAVIVFLVDTYMRILFPNKVVFTLCCSMIASVAAIFMVRFGFGCSVDKIMIGHVMLMIPGAQLVNSLRDLLNGDIISGLLRIVEASMTAISAAIGVGLALLMFGGML